MGKNFSKVGNGEVTWATERGNISIKIKYKTLQIKKRKTIKE